MRHSMTGYATRDGVLAGMAWTWELRGVNNRGLDLRLRLPDGVAGLEPFVRKALAARLARGSVQVALRMGADGTRAGPVLDDAALAAVLDALAEIEGAAMAAGVSLAPSTAAHVAGLRGVLSHDAPEATAPAADLGDALRADFGAVLDAFCADRAAEGARLAAVLGDQLDTIAALIATARDRAEARAPERAARLRAQLARVLEEADGVDPARLAQELALIAVKADVTEELDRLDMHVAAARAHLDEPAPVGRKLDFLCQEFMREANTLCSKSGDAALTETGLTLKTVIEQMREQVQNLE